tara:strand:- start:16882 stop:17856 length:975 start_codon:yes stop_codon:yes gene_type:complete
MMQFLFHLALLAGGIVVLLVASDLLVRGSVGLAERLKIEPLIVGLTVVAFGTSMPEMFVSAEAVLAGASGIALGNIVGSNTANVLLVLGVSALIYPMSSRLFGLRSNAIVLALASLAFSGALYGLGEINFRVGLLLLMAVLGYVVIIGWRAKSGGELDSFSEELLDIDQGPHDLRKIIPFLLLGLSGLPFGASLIIDHGAEIARSMHIREEVIGLSLIALGTSLPELVTVVASALRKQSDLALGNVVGSNIFNLLAVGGVAGVVGGAEVSEAGLRFDLPVMLVASGLLVLLVLFGVRLGRFQGAAFLCAYIAYIGALAHSAGLV